MEYTEISSVSTIYSDFSENSSANLFHHKNPNRLFIPANRQEEKPERIQEKQRQKPSHVPHVPDSR